MANRSMALDVLVRLKDLLSSPLRRLQRTLQGITGMAKKIGLVGTAIAAISFMQPIKEAAAFQQSLLDIASTSNLTGAKAFSMVDELKGKYEGLSLLVGQSSETIAKGAGQMIAAGLGTDIVDRSLFDIGKAAKAANADFADMAGVATSLLQTLKLPADQLSDTLAGLTVAGKEGAFELKDMAKYFPTLTGQMAKLGITGRSAATQLSAMLQIARKGTSDPAEAANNLKNFLDKITAPETVRNFQKLGVDIQGVMQNAVVQGINPIEAVLQKITKLTGVSGGEIEGLMKKATASGLTGADALEQVRKQLEAIHGAGALGQLFADQQVTGFLIPALANVNEYLRIRDLVASATGAMTDEDFATQMKSLNTQLIIFGEIGTQAWREVGFAFGTWLPWINENLAAGLKLFREWDASTEGMGKKALTAAGGGVLLAGALGALGVVVPYVVSGISLLLSPLRLLAQGGVVVATALAGPAMAALTAIGGAVASISAPIWALVAAVAAVGLAVYRYWQPISNWVVGFGSGVAKALEGPLTAMQDFNAKVTGWAGKKLLDFAKWVGLDEATVNTVTGRLSGFADYVVQKIKAIPAMVGNFLSEIFTMKDYSEDAQFGFKMAGQEAGAAFVNAFKEYFGKLIEFFKGFPDMVVKAIGNIDLSSIIKLPDWKSILPQGWTGSTPESQSSAGPASNDNAPGPSVAPSGGVAAPQKHAAIMPAVAPLQRVAFADGGTGGLPRDLGGTIHITADPGLKVASAVPKDRAMTFKPLNTGRMLGS